MHDGLSAYISIAVRNHVSVTYIVLVFYYIGILDTADILRGLHAPQRTLIGENSSPETTKNRLFIRRVEDLRMDCRRSSKISSTQVYLRV